MTFLLPVVSDGRIPIFKGNILDQRTINLGRLVQTLKKVDAEESVKSENRFSRMLAGQVQRSGSAFNRLR